MRVPNLVDNRSLTLPLWTYFAEVFLDVLLMFGIMFNWITSDQMFVNPGLYFYAICKL